MRPVRSRKGKCGNCHTTSTHNTNDTSPMHYRWSQAFPFADRVATCPQCHLLVFVE
jgi:hypothetical protein